jgi:thiol-disulfide isomerase/thioredoxin
MAELKKTQDPKVGWISLAALVVVSVMFGLIVLPRIGGRADRRGEIAPDFTLEVIHGGDPGNRIRLSELRGKVVLLDFWASWCVPCREQMPVVDRIAARYTDKGVVVVGVSTSDRRADAVAFLRSSSVSYPCVFDEGSRVGTAYDVRSLPGLVVIDRQGRVSAVRTRLVSEGELEGLVSQALGGSS